MNERMLLLAERIRDEFVSLEIVRERALGSWQKHTRTPSEDAFIDSTVLNLHGFYNGLETLFQMIAEVVDNAVPHGAEWHTKLLAQMATDMPPHRPAVISSATFAGLSKYRGFRHVARKVYSFNFDPLQVEKLVNLLPTVYIRLTPNFSLSPTFWNSAPPTRADHATCHPQR